MDAHDYLEHDATGLAALVREGRTTPQALLDFAEQRARQLNPRLNAIHHLMPDEARAQVARLAALPQAERGPLHGVPFLLKDVAQEHAGHRTRSGSRGMSHLPVPQVHSAYVRRSLDAGLVIFGKTTTPELALKAVTETVAFGRTANPWHLGHVPGGSSGGAAAAVAAGIVPMAAASDGGGSIRIPAACCGLFGLKPSRGRVSMGPQAGEIWDGASTQGVISRSVRDAALALDVHAGAEPGDPFAIATPPMSFVTLAAQAPRRLRIGVCVDSPIGTPVHPQAVAAVRAAEALLRRLGHEVEEATVEVDGPALAKAYLHMYFGHVSADMRTAMAHGAKASDFETLTRVLGVLGDALSAGEYVQWRSRWNGFAQGLAAFHARHDLLLTPTLAHPPIRHGQADPPGGLLAAMKLGLSTGLLRLLARAGALGSVVDQTARDNLVYTPYTQLANLTGTPAMSVPLHWTPEGLPLGVQFVAPFGDEATLLQLAAQLEAAQPWMQRLPALAREGLSRRP